MKIRDLTPEEYKICEQQAVISSFIDVVPVNNPKAIFVLAQPGAGKTGLTGFVLQEFANREAESILHIDPDRISIFHKYYTQITMEKPTETYTELRKFTGPALRTINKIAVEKRVNILTEGTFRDKENYLVILRNLQKNNYSIELNFLAVGSIESMISTMERFYYMEKLGMPLRSVEKKFHDMAYYGMIDTLRAVEKSGLFSKIKIYTRGDNERAPNLAFSKDDKNSYQSAADMLQFIRAGEQKKVLSDEENLNSRLNRIRSKIQEEDDKYNQMEKLRQIELEICKETQRENAR